MHKARSKRKPPSRTNDGKTKTRNVRRMTARNGMHSQPNAGRESKKAQIILMLQAPDGATIEAMARATQWQPHSVRGFLSGVVRKKLGLTVVSADSENGRVYRIADRTALAAA